MVEEVKHDGRKVRIGGRDYIIPALSFRLLRVLEADLKLVGGGPETPETRAAALRVITACIRRNYPDVTEEQMEDELDLRNVMQVIEAIRGESGMEILQRGEAVPPQ